MNLESKWRCVVLAILGFVSCAGAQNQSSTPSPALLILEKDNRTLAIVDPAILKVIARAPAGEDPHELAVSADGRTAYITNYGAFTTPQHMLSVVDLAGQKPLPSIDLVGLIAPHGIQAVNDRIYFTAEGSKALGRYDYRSGRVDWVLGVGENRAHMVVVSPDEQRIFTSDVNSDAISIFERDRDADISGWKQTVVPVGKGPEGFDVSPDGRELWAANSHQGTVSIVDIATRKLVGTIELHTKMSNRLKFTPDGRMVLISDLGTGDLVVVDAKSRLQLKRLNVGHSAAGVLIAPDGRQAFIAAPRDRGVVVVDLLKLAASGRIETEPGPDGMAWAVQK